MPTIDGAIQDGEQLMQINESVLTGVEDAIQLVLHHLVSSSLLLQGLVDGLAAGRLTEHDLVSNLEMLSGETGAARKRAHVALLRIGLVAHSETPASAGD